MMKILSIDFGLKRMGFAVGDTTLRTAAPITPLKRKNKDQDIHHIKNLIPEYDIDKIIIGYPLNMDGTKSKITIQVENFAKHIKKKIHIETEFVDERLTSFEAEEVLKSYQPNHKKRKQILDSISAFIILKSYMEIE
jgi:putative Holliday junction resolvase